MRRSRIVSDRHLRRMQLCRGVEAKKEWSIISETVRRQYNVESVNLTSSRIRARFSVGIHHCESTLLRLRPREEGEACGTYLRSSSEPAELLSQVRMCLL